MKYRIAIFLFLSTFIAFSQNPNDCEFAIVICGDSSLGIEPVGIGFDEFSLPGNFVPNCYSFDHHNIWFKFEFIESGTFTFDLVPENGYDDYDFAIYGPNATCTNLGHAIRCSSTNPENAGVQVATGLNMTEIDTEEGPGEDGNGYLKYIDAVAGQVYYLLVDRAVGSGPFSIFYTGTAKLPNEVQANQAPDLFQCDTDDRPDEQTNFNLESQTNTIVGDQSGVTVTYHINLNDASIGINRLSSPYRNISNPQTIYARIERNNGCSDITTFDLKIGNPELLEPADVVLCSYGSSEAYVLDTIIPEVILDPTGYVFTYHTSEQDAIDHINAIGPTVDFTRNPLRIYVRVTDQTDVDCFSVTSFRGYINTIKIAGQPTDVIACDVNGNERISVDLSQKDLELLNGRNPADFEIKYFTSPADRLAGINDVSGMLQNTENPQTIFISFEEKATGCFDYTQFQIKLNLLPSPEFKSDSYIYCLNATQPLAISVQAGFEYYVWNTGEEGRNLNKIFVDAPGTYSVTVTNRFGCENNTSVVVFPSDVATIIGLDIVDFNGQNNSVTINVEGPGDYEYALDGQLLYQDENFFNGLKNGFHTIYVRDKNGCGVVSREFLVLDYPRYFTPNNDGYHDYWQIIGMDNFPNAKIYIFDRFGRLIKRVPPTSLGWDGKNLNGVEMPSSDYWFRIEMENRPEYTGHFTLKR